MSQTTKTNKIICCVVSSKMDFFFLDACLFLTWCLLIDTVRFYRTLCTTPVPDIPDSFPDLELWYHSGSTVWQSAGHRRRLSKVVFFCYHTLWIKRISESNNGIQTLQKYAAFILTDNKHTKMLNTQSLQPLSEFSPLNWTSWTLIYCQQSGI